jgi:glycosyltransferase involved in cell wall biosynthesis
MKIALISPHYGPPWNEGVRNMARCLVEFLQSKGEEVFVISRKLMAESRSFGPALLRVPLLRSVAFNIFALRQVKKVKPEIVLVLASLSSALGIKCFLLRKTVKKPLILYITGLRGWTLGYQFLLNAEKIVVNSDFLKDFFEEAEVIPPFIDATKFVKKDKDTPSSNVILFLGEFERVRGVEYLIKAMTHLNGRVKAKLVLAWNGRGANRYHHILKTIRESGAESQIELVGSSDPAALYAKASLVVIPRITRERMAFPLRILEAITMGVPLIVTRINQMDEIIDGCGLSVEPGDEKAMAMAIERLLTDTDFYRRCVDGCRKKAEEFSSEKSLEKLYANLRRCLEPASKTV